MKALELADLLENNPYHFIADDKAAAAELRRLAEVNAELVEALKRFADVSRAESLSEVMARLDGAYKNAVQVIVKAKEQQ